MGRSHLKTYAFKSPDHLGSKQLPAVCPRHISPNHRHLALIYGIPFLVNVGGWIESGLSNTLSPKYPIKTTSGLTTCWPGCFMHSRNRCKRGFRSYILAYVRVGCDRMPSLNPKCSVWSERTRYGCWRR